MSRPRKPFGATHPGRLPATMMKVLAAEMSDPQRLRRGKQYAHDGSVLDIVIEAGVVTCEVQGSRSTPYIARIEVTAGDGMPLRRDISTRCTCPDDDNWDDYACKHVVASMFTLSDELLLEPELLDVWRRRGVSADRPPTTRGHLTLVHSDTAHPDTAHPDNNPAHGGPVGNDGPGRRERFAPPRDPLDGLLSVPAGAELPTVPTLDPVEPALPKRPELARVISDALRHVRVDWE